jgi:imidazolonepropionase-like amidohydrolase
MMCLWAGVCASALESDVGDNGLDSGEGLSDSILVLSGVALFDGTGRPLRRDVDVIIEGPNIRSISEHSGQDAPASAKVLHLEGAYAIPGLIEGHAHLTPASEKSLEMMLQAGITSVRDMGGDGAYLKDLQRTIEDGEVQGPEIYFSALLGGPDLILSDARAKLSTPMDYEMGEAPWMRVIEESTHIYKVVRDAVECGARGVKIYSHISGEVVKEISSEAHRQGLKVWAHSVVFPATCQEVVKAGVDVISHAPGLLCGSDWVPGCGVFDFDPDEIASVRFTRVLRAMVEHGTMLDPTLAIFEQSLARHDAGANSKKRQAMYEVVRQAHASGIPLVVGTDLPPARSRYEKQPLYLEMELLVDEVGLTPIETLTAATRNNAMAIGIEDSHGTLEPGKVADIVIVDSDPTGSLPGVSQIVMVIKDGRIVGRRSGGRP